MSDPKDQMEWATATFGEDLGKYEDDIYDQVATLMLVRATYKIFKNYWPHALENPESPDRSMAEKINKVEKIVFSKTLKEVSWRNSKIF